MKRLVGTFVVSLLLAGSPLLHAEIDSAKKELIDKLLEQTGQSATAVGQQMGSLFIRQITSMLQASNPNIDPRAITIMEEEVTAVMEEELTASFATMIYPIYDRHFSEQELAQMIEINSTPLGQKMIRVMPQVMQESIVAGQTLGSELGPKIDQRLRKRFAEEGIQ